MSNTEQHLKRIQDKLQQLLKQYAALQKENSRLIQELASAQQKLAAYQKNTDELKQQVSVLKLSNGEMNEADKKEFTRQTFDRAIDSMNAVNDEIAAIIQSTWGRNGKKA